MVVHVHLKFDYRKATQSLNFFAIKSGGTVNKLKAIKLVYFADRYHLRKYGRPITNDEYFAMFLGPVNSGVKDIAEMSEFLGPKETEYANAYVSMSGKYDIESIKDYQDTVLSESDVEALSFAWERFGRLTEFELAELTHRYPEWKKHEETLKDPSRSRIRMNYEDFLDDPTEPVEKCYRLTPEDREDRLVQLRELENLESLWG